MGDKFVGQLKEAGWLDYAIFFLYIGHIEICSWANYAKLGLKDLASVDHKIAPWHLPSTW
jgi:hypothetical protein